MSGYLPVLILFFVGLTIALAVIIGVSFLGPKRPNKFKNSVIECGVPPSGDADRKSTRLNSSHT